MGRSRAALVTWLSLGKAASLVLSNRAIRMGREITARIASASSAQSFANRLKGGRRLGIDRKEKRDVVRGKDDKIIHA